VPGLPRFGIQPSFLRADVGIRRILPAVMDTHHSLHQSVTLSSPPTSSHIAAQAFGANSFADTTLWPGMLTFSVGLESTDHTVSGALSRQGMQSTYKLTMSTCRPDWHLDVSTATPSTHPTSRVRSTEGS